LSDNTTAFQAAINAAYAAGGGTVIVPAGRWRFSPGTATPIVVKQNVILRGAASPSYTWNAAQCSTSTTNLSIATGPQTLTVATTSAGVVQIFTAGMSVIIAHDNSNYMTGTVTSYDSGTGSLSVNVTSVVGSGSYSSWCTNLYNGLVTGSVMEINWGAGSGYSLTYTHSAILLNNGGTIDSIAFDYPAQIWNLSSPIEYGPTITIYDTANNTDQTVINCWFNKSYVAINAMGSLSCGIANMVVSNCEGCPMSFLIMDLAVDWFDVKDCNFNAGRISQNHLTTGLVAWIATYGQLLQAWGNDWFTAINIQAWGWQYSAYIVGKKNYAGGGPYTFLNCAFDASRQAIYISGDVSQCVKVQNCTFAAFNNATNEVGSTISIASGSNLGGLIYTNNFAFGPLAQMVWLGQASQTVKNIIIANNYARNDGSAVDSAIVIASGDNIMACNNILHGFSSAVSFGTATNTISSNNLT
jgi:hypothetical protein